MHPINYTVFHNIRAEAGSFIYDRSEGTFLHLLIQPESWDTETALQEPEQPSYQLFDVGHMIPRPGGRLVIPELKPIGDKLWHWLDLWN